MKLGLRWSAKMRPETRKMAEEAARRSGLSINDWLDSVVAHQAGQPRVSSPPLSDDAFHGGDLETVNYRLDRLSQRIDQMSGGGPAAYAPKRTREDLASAPPAAPSLPMPPSLERALAEIAARQRTLASYPPAPQPQTAVAPPPAPLHAQHLAGLEEQLRNLNNQIEILRKPGVEEAIHALREELCQIGKTLRDAMPRRELEAVEKQIQALDRRIAESRQAGIDADALVGIEHGLAEIRDAIGGLMPAETLTGYTEEVANLARKIEVIVAQNDPATIAQLEQAVTTLREISGRIASNDTVRGLAAQVHQLGDKIDAMAQIGGGAGEAAFGQLEQRIAMLSDALSESRHDGGPMSPQLEALLQQISEKIDGLHSVPDSGAAFGHLEDHIVKLAEKLDATDTRLGPLEGIERALADLLVHFETARNSAQANADEDPAVLDLQLKIARTQDTLEAVHGTLGHVVERLATIEKDIREQPQAVAAPAIRTPVALNPAFVEDAPSIAAPMTAPDDAIAPPAQRRPSADPDLPDNQPLEPGSGRPPNPAARIAESEAALGDTALAAPATPAGGKSSFIAAARRAAQAANQQPSRRAQRADTTGVTQAKPSSLRDKMMKRAKPLIIAASIIAIVVGSVQIAGNVFKWTNPFIKLGDAISPTAGTGTPGAIARAGKTVQQDKLTTTGSIDANPVVPDSAVAPLAPPPMGNNVLATGPAPVSPLTPVSPSLFGPPILPPKDDVTGSIPPVTAIPATNPATSPALSVPPLGERLPPGIGGPKLRSAALAGDAAAAYAVAQRYAEGKGVPVNMEEAAHWFERAANKGLVPAQFRYASLLEKGLGVKKDLAQARSLYLAAAAKGNAKAMHNLAVLYAEGAEGKPDYAAAIQWFRKAAEHGVADSQYNLGVLYARGLGTEQSYAEAYKWFALAAAEGDGEAAKKRDEVAGRLDPATLAAAEKSVTTFVATPQPPEAITVREPQGGWDHAAKQPARGNPRTAPLALSAFQTGKQ